MGFFTSKTTDEYYQDGAKAYREQKYRNAVNSLKKAANAGHVEAAKLLYEYYTEVDTEYTIHHAIKYLRVAAEGGDAYSQTLYGKYCSLNNFAVPEDEKGPQGALRWYEKAAAQGYPIAQYMIAQTYAHGDGVPVDKKKAYHWAKLASDQHHEDAEKLCSELAADMEPEPLTVAEQAYEARDYQTALPLFEQVAEMGDASAQYRCGMMYAQGQGTTVDKERALCWYENAAMKGNSRAALYCAEAYYSGVGTQKDLDKVLSYSESALKDCPEAQELLDRVRNENGTFFEARKSYMAGDYGKAFSLFGQAANQGLEVAVYYIALMYEKGQGVEANVNKAIDLYQEAGERGYTEAMFRLGKLYQAVAISKRLGDNGTANAWKMALHCFLLAAKAGHINAMLNCGHFFRDGKGTGKDGKSAISWYKAAADRGSAIGQSYCGVCYTKGIGVAKDDKVAFSWFEKAAKQGLMEAQFNVGALYSNGTGVAENDEAALYWMEKAAEQGMAQAQNECGKMYYNGRGTAQNHEKAAFWFKRSAQQGNAEGQRLYSDMC